MGPWGESLAAQYLKKKGYKILACNYRTRFGEIDVIARTRDVVACVEVKLRKSADLVHAREYVGYQKQARVMAAAEVWMCENASEDQLRFDVIEIYAPEGLQTKRPEIIHLEDAFQ